MAHENNNRWLRKWLRFEPHQTIGGLTHPYLRRWYVIPRNRVMNIYLHHFLRSDDDRALHDHPWWFASLILKGAYWEHRANRPESTRSYRRAGSIAFRLPSVAHRVELETERTWQGTSEFDAIQVERELPTWTLIVTGPRVRPWGFHCAEGWKFWEDFDHDNGCGEPA